MNTSLLIVILIGLVLPVVSARVAKAHWDPSITGLITGGLAAADGVAGDAVTAAVTHHAFDMKSAAYAALLAWAASQLTQRGILSGTQLEARLLNAGSNATDDQDSEDPEDPTLGLDDDLEVEIDDDGFGPEPHDPDQPAAGVPPASVWAGPEHAAVEA